MQGPFIIFGIYWVGAPIKSHGIQEKIIERFYTNGFGILTF